MTANEMNCAELFTQAGQFLCGLGPKWKEQFGTMLDIRTNTVDNMSKGTSRIPAGIWTEIGRLIQGRIDDLPALHVRITDAMRKADNEEFVFSGPASTPFAYGFAPTDGVAFSPQLFAIMNDRISEMEFHHPFKTLKIVPGESGNAIIEAPRKLPTATLHRLHAWLRHVEGETSYPTDKA